MTAGGREEIDDRRPAVQRLLRRHRGDGQMVVSSHDAHQIAVGGTGRADVVTSVLMVGVVLAAAARVAGQVHPRH